MSRVNNGLRNIKRAEWMIDSLFYTKRIDNNAVKSFQQLQLTYISYSIAAFLL